MLRPPAPVPVRRLVPVLALGVLALAGCGAGPAAPSAPGETVAVPSVAATPTGGATTGSGGADTVSCSYTEDGEASREATLPPTTDVPATGTVTYTIDLSGEDVALTLDRAAAPCTVNSFVSLAEQGFFNGTSCHRLVDSGILVLQCGDPSGSGSGGPGYSFANEVNGGETYTEGVVAMANAGPDTNGSQFFLVYGDSTALDPQPGEDAGYTIFATMDAAGRDVVAGIAAQGQDGSNPDGSGKPNAPAEIVEITKS